MDSSAEPQRLGRRVRLSIERLTLGGEGVGRLGELAVFVPYAAPGDQLEVEIVQLQSRFARARITRILTASPQRMEPPCRYHFSLTSTSPSLYCGGCSWQHLNYPAQLEAKRQLVQETLERIGRIRGVTVNPVLGMADPWRYRNKVQQPVGWNGRQVISGFYAPSSHEIVPIEDCLVQPELSVQILNRARVLMQTFHLQPYDEKSYGGWIRHGLVRTSQDYRALLVFVTRTEDFPHENEILSLLLKECPALVGIHQNINSAKTNVILGRHWRKLWGADTLEERLGPLKFRLSPRSFFQVNSSQAEVLYDCVKRMAGRGSILWDLYGGVGGIALWLAEQFDRVVGVDEVPDAARDAQDNARLNGIRNAQFLAEPVETFLRKHTGGRISPGLTVVLDPPRAGCSPQVLQALIKTHPPKLIYVSCDPGTLARDLEILGKAGYSPREIQPIDLFPHTPHIETVVHLAH